MPPHPLTADTAIEPWQAFIIKAESADAALLMSYPQSGRNQAQPLFLKQKPEKMLSSNPAAQANWELVLSASTPKSSSSVVLGVANNAQDGFDPMDIPVIPFKPFKDLELRVNNQDWENNAGYYQRDIRDSESAAPRWQLELNLEDLLEDGCYEGKIRLELDSTFRLPEGTKFLLADERSGAHVNLLESHLELEINIDLSEPGSDAIIPLSLSLVDASVPDIQISELSTTNYPNPFNPETIISYQLPADGVVSLKIYNIKGQKVRTLIDAPQKKGLQQVLWNGMNDKGEPCSSGFYFYRIKHANESITRKILMLK